MIKKLSGFKKTFNPKAPGVKRSPGITKSPKPSNLVGKPPKNKPPRGF